MDNQSIIAALRRAETLLKQAAAALHADAHSINNARQILYSIVVILTMEESQRADFLGRLDVGSPHVPGRSDKP